MSSHQSSRARARSPITESEDAVVRPFAIVPKPASKKKPKNPTGFYRRVGGTIWWWRRTIDGVQYNETSGLTDLKEAQKWADDRVTAIRSGNRGWSPKTMPTVRQHFLARERHTEYDNQLVAFVRMFAKIKFDQVTDEMCRKFMAVRLTRITRIKKLVSPGTVRTECLHIAAWFNRNVGRRKLLRENPWRLVAKEEKVILPEPSVRERILEPAEQEPFFAAIGALTTRRHSAAMLERLARIVVGCGLRRNEILYLAPADVHHGKIFVPKEIAKRKKARTVPVTADVLALLETQREERGLDPRSTSRLFEVSENYIEEVFRRASAKADLETPVWLHDLRRTYASRMAFKVQPKVLQLLMGHVNLKTTMTHYAQVNVEMLASVVTAAGSVLAP